MNAVNKYIKKNPTVSTSNGFIENVSLHDLYQFALTANSLIRSEIKRLDMALDKIEANIDLPELIY